MKILLVSALTASALAVGTKLATEYKPDAALRVEVEATMKMETTSTRMERDGEPVDAPGGGGGSSSEVHVDQVVEAEKGKPRKIRRNFEKVSGSSISTFGDNSRETELESPLEHVTLEIERDAEGAVDVSVVDGTKPDDEKALEGHVPELFLDALLPSGDVEVDATWDLDKDAIRRALRIDVERALYAPPRQPEGGTGGAGERGRRGGMRGMGGGDSRLLQDADWKGKAKLVAADKDVDGTACAVIELELEAAGDLPEQPMGQGGPQRRDGMPSLASGTIPVAKSTYEIKLEGKLFFAAKERRPVSLDLEGTVKTETDREFTRNEVKTRVQTVREGTLAFKVGIEPAGKK